MSESNEKKAVEEVRRAELGKYFQELFSVRSSEIGKTQTDFANYMGVTQGAIWQRLKGGRINVELLYALIDFLKISIDDIDPRIISLILPGSEFELKELVRARSLMSSSSKMGDLLATMTVGESAAQYQPNPDFVHVPKSSLSAGLGNGTLDFESEQIVDSLAFKSEWINRKGLNAKSLALVTCKGDSMSPTLVNGDLALVDLRITSAEDGIMALAIDNSVSVKRIQAGEDRSVRVISDNEKYETKTYSTDEADTTLRIIGKVVWIGRDLN